VSVARFHSAGDSGRSLQSGSVIHDSAGSSLISGFYSSISLVVQIWFYSSISLCSSWFCWDSISVNLCLLNSSVFRFLLVVQLDRLVLSSVVVSSC